MAGCYDMFMQNNNRTTNILLGIIALVLIVGIGLFLAKRNVSAPVADTTVPTADSTPTVTPPTSPSTPGSTVPAGMHQYSDTSFGFAVDYPESDTVTSSGSGMASIAVAGSAAPITLVGTANTALDANGKWGPYTISYVNGGYIVQQESEETGSMTSKPIAPIAYTASGLPIFNGNVPNHGWGTYDYIVALSTTKFLKVSGPDTLNNSVSYDASADPTFAIAKTVTVQ